MPPWRWCGARIEPWREAPVPFWRRILRVEPATSPRVFVDALPRRRFARVATSAWCTTGPFGAMPNTPSSTSMVSTSLPVASCTVSFIALLLLALRALLRVAHAHGAVRRARHGAFDHEQVPRLVLRDHAQVLRCHLVRAHVARHVLALVHAPGGGAGADRARRAVAVRLAVRLRAAAEAPAADAAREAAPARDTDHVHQVALGEQVDTDRVADAVLALAAHAELPQEAEVAQLLEVAAHRLREVLLVAVADLDRGVAVFLRALDLRDDDGPGLDHRDVVDLAVLVEDLGHPQLASEQALEWHPAPLTA